MVIKCKIHKKHLFYNATSVNSESKYIKSKCFILRRFRLVLQHIFDHVVMMPLSV